MVGQGSWLVIGGVALGVVGSAALRGIIRHPKLELVGVKVYSEDKDGLDAIHTHMTNTMNTPVEVIESAYPLKVICYNVRDGSGGKGRHRGGDGLIREYKMLV